MRYVAAYLLAVLGGNNNPSAKDIKNILGSVGIEADDERLNKVDLHLNITDLFIIQLLNTVVLNTGLQYLPSPFNSHQRRKYSKVFNIFLNVCIFITLYFVLNHLWIKLQQN